jgi:hypothetical protein
VFARDKLVLAFGRFWVRIPAGTLAGLTEGFLPRQYLDEAATASSVIQSSDAESIIL